jgi:hypothetical protein
MVHLVHKTTTLRVIGFYCVDSTEKFTDIQSKLEDLISNEMMTAIEALV